MAAEVLGGAASAAQANHQAGQWSADLVQHLSVTLLGFLLMVLAMAGLLLWRAKARPDHVLKVFTVITVLGLATVLLVAGYSNEQLTPIIGLFGAIGGYVLAKDPPKASAEADPEPPPHA